MKLKKAIISSAVCAVFSLQVAADQQFLDDVIVDGSLCVGQDCVNGEGFSFDTIRLKENNLRIKFQDTSTTGSFPSVDWQLTANDSSNGGENHFAIENIDNGTIPFKVMSGAGTNALHIAASGNVGFGTSTPIVELHVKSGNTPTLRLEQDGSSGFAAQSWDVGGNETNFFVRDTTNGSLLPFKIFPGASNNSLIIDPDGDVGIGTASPDGMFDIAHPSDANNHAVLVSSTGNFGINIDNGSNPTALFDIQSTGGNSEFSVSADGSTTVNGSATINGALDVTGTIASILLQDTSIPASADVKTLLTINSEHGSNIKFQHRNNVTRDWTLGTYSSGNGFIFSRDDISDGNADPYDNYMLLLNDNNMTFRNTSGTELMKVTDSSLTINGTFVSASSRTFKENIVPVNAASILRALSKLNISTWNYISDENETKHLGPIAEEFYAAFGLGPDNKHITTTDANGVALASVIALNQKLAERAEQIRALQEKNEVLENRMKLFEEKLIGLEL